MRTGFIAIVVLCLTAHSPAYAEVSAGLQCVNDCLRPDAADTSVARSAFQQFVRRSSAMEDARCTSFERTLKCVEGCPVGKYAALARTIIRTWNKYCGDNVPETTKEKFFADDEQFQKRFAAEFEKCKGEGAPDTPDKTCKWLSDCLFGSALTSAKSGVSDDVVSVTVNWQKIYNGALLETSDGENLPSSCELLLFKPSEPEAPYEPVPYPYKPYSYEHYQPEPYQRDPYQSNPYQRNPYQRNPYQRNPYQRNPYQHNSYQRSPYKRRN